MADQFAEFIVIHNKAGLGELVFPKFAGVVKENSSDQQIKIQLRIKRRDLLRHPHHLCRVFNQPAAMRVMIFARGSGAAEPVPPFFQECFA